ncbi:MAG TPA: hypothetical protein V6D28_19995 [Leptolyngbyaceae cyanobacterium]
MNDREWAFLQPVLNDEEVNKLRSKLNKVITGCGDQNEVMLKKKANWVAVPVESGDHFSDDDIKKLLQAILEHGYEEMIAIAFEKLKAFPPAFVVPATTEAIEEFDFKCAPFWFTMYAGEPDWAIICTKLNYFVLFGKESFVKKVLGCELDEAFGEFYDFLSDYCDSDPLKKILLSVYHRLLYAYPRVEHETIIKL